MFVSNQRVARNLLETSTPDLQIRLSGELGGHLVGVYMSPGRDGITCSEYHDHCLQLVDIKTFEKFFPELLVLLPDIAKQQVST